MQDREISIKSGIDKFFDFGYKVLYGGFEEKPLNLGRDCGEAHVFIIVMKAELS